MRAQTIDVQHIALDLRFDWTKKRAIGKTTITLSPLSVTGKIALDAGFLAIHSVKTAAGTLLQFEYDGGDPD